MFTKRVSFCFKRNSALFNPSLFILFKALPRPPGTPVVTESTATSITLTWDSGNPEPVTYYIIQHKPKNSEELYKEIDGVATTRYSVAGLSPYSEYEFRVVAVNNIGRGPPSEPVLTRTSEQAPSSAPRNVQARMLSSTTILVQWEEPEEPNGQIQGYRVYYTMEPTQHINSWTKYNVADSQITTIGNLVPQKTYSVKVLAFTSVGDGPLSNEIQVITQTGGRYYFMLLVVLYLQSLRVHLEIEIVVYHLSLFFQCLHTVFTYIFECLR